MSEAKQTTNLIIRLEGPALDNGIDVFELAPALLAVGTIIKESNDILNPLGKEVGINVKPFEHGESSAE